MQLYLVILLGAIFVWGTYFFLIRMKNIRALRFYALHTNLERKGWWLVYQNWLDGKKD
jgi:hypothetical protein